MRRIILILIAGLSLLAITVGFWLKGQILDSNTSFEKKQSVFVRTDSDKSELQSVLEPFVKNINSFERVSEWMKFESIKPGHYLIETGMSNLDLVRKFRAGDQSPVRLTFVKARTLQRLAGMLTNNLEADSAKLFEILTSEQYLKEIIINDEELLGRFIPNTYEIWWNTSEKKLVEKLLEEYDKFWTAERELKLEQLDLSRNEAITLASIVEEETNMTDEKARVAGVYLNRIKNGWPLEADPTLKFALGDFEIKRVLNAHKEVESPYNTYKYRGLPPGPICTPSIRTIDAVLGAESHKYFFFCASEDFSGYHNFARTLDEHNLNARRYQNALNQRRIF